MVNKRGWKLSKETRKKIGDSNRETYKNPAVKKRLSRSIKKWYRSDPKHKEEASERSKLSMIKVWKNPEFRSKFLIHLKKLGDSQRLENNPNWKGRNYNRIVFDIYKKPRVCERCGSRRQIIVHHKDHDNTNNAVENLEVLCRSCHNVEHKRGVPFTKKHRDNMVRAVRRAYRLKMKLKRQKEKYGNTGTSY